MPKSNVLDTRSNKKENEYKKQILLPALRQNAKGDYADLLDDYNVKITADKHITGGAASIDATKGVIYLDPEFALGNDTALLATLVKHEILHALLNHLYRGFNKMAEELGIDPRNVSKEDWQRIYELNAKVNHVFNPNFKDARTNNIAADLDLARLYSSEEIEALSKLGGLIRDEYPEYKNLSYEEMRDAINKEEKHMKWRLAKKIYGTYNSDGSFTVDYEEDNEFDSNIINIEDIRGITLPKLRWKNALLKFFGSIHMWFIDKNPDDVAECASVLYHDGSIGYDVVDSSNYVRLVLLVRNLSHYKIENNVVILPGNNWNRDKTYWYRIPNTNYIISREAYGPIKFNEKISKLNDYDGSDIEKELNETLDLIRE